MYSITVDGIESHRFVAGPIYTREIFQLIDDVPEWCDHSEGRLGDEDGCGTSAQSTQYLSDPPSEAQLDYWVNTGWFPW